MTFLDVLEGSLKSASDYSISLKSPLPTGRSTGFVPFFLEEIGELQRKVFRFEIMKGDGA